MYLNRIKARLSGAPRSGHVGGLRLSDPRQRHFLRNNDLGMPLLNRMRNGRGRNRLFACDVNSRVTAAVTKLYRGLCAGTVDRVDKPTQPGQKAVVINTKLEIPMLSGA